MAENSSTSTQELKPKAPKERSEAERPYCISALGHSECIDNTHLASKNKSRNFPTLRYCRSGQGSQTNPDCGQPKFTIACTAKTDKHRDATKRLVRKSCKSLTCPACYRSGASRAAKSIERRLEGLHGEYLKASRNLGKPKHIVFSPPQNLFTIQNFTTDGGKSAANQLIQLLDDYMRNGAYGGTVITHLERRKHHDGSECDHENCHKRHVWAWGPHFHYIGYGYMANSDYFHSATRWIYKRIEDNGQQRDIRSTAFYLLTHSANYIDQATGQRKGQGYRMVGWMHNCKGGKQQVGHDLTSCPCPLCQANLHKFGQVLNQQILPTEKPAWDNDQGEYVRSVPVYRWHLNWKTYQQLKLEDSSVDPPEHTRKKQKKKGSLHEEQLPVDQPDEGFLHELRTGLCERCNQPLEQLPNDSGMLILYCPSCTQEGLSRASSGTSRHEVPT